MAVTPKSVRQAQRQKAALERAAASEPEVEQSTWSIKRSRTAIKKQRAERARRNAGTSSTKKRNGHKKMAAPSPSIRGQSGSTRKGRPKRPQPRSRR